MKDQPLITDVVQIVLVVTVFAWLIFTPWATIEERDRVARLQEAKESVESQKQADIAEITQEHSRHLSQCRTCHK